MVQGYTNRVDLLKKAVEGAAKGGYTGYLRKSAEEYFRLSQSAGHYRPARPFEWLGRNAGAG
jgi:hypothetical protein